MTFTRNLKSQNWLLIHIVNKGATEERIAQTKKSIKRGKNCIII